MADPIFDQLLQQEQTRAAGRPAGSDSTFDLLLAAEERRKVARMGQLNQAVAVNPDQYSAQRKVANQLGYPVGAVQALPDLQAQAKVQQIQRDTADAPVLAQKYGDADFARLAHDDSGILAKLAKLPQGLKRGWTQADSQAEMTDLLYAELNGRTLTMPERNRLTELKRLNQQLADEQLRGEGALGYIGRTTGYSARQMGSSLYAKVEGAGYGGAAGAAMGAPIAGVGAAPGAATGMLVGGLMSSAMYSYKMEAANAFDEFRNMRDVNGQALDVETARTAARGVGVVNAVIESGSDLLIAKLIPGFDRVVNTALGADAKKQLVKETVGRVMSNPALRGPLMQALGKMASGAAIEGIEEFVQTLTGAGAREIAQGASGQTFKPDSLSADLAEASQSAADAAVGTFFTMMPVGGANYISVRRRMQREAEFNDAMDHAQRLQQALITAGESKLRQRSPETLQSLVQEMAEGTEGAQTSVHIDAGVLNQAAQTMQPGELERLLPSVTAQLPDALAANSTVEIPIGEVVANLPGTSLEQVFLQNARQTATAPSLAERDQAAKEAETLLQTEYNNVMQQAQDQQAWQLEMQGVKDTIKQQLDAAGRFTSDVNEAYATLQMHFFGAMSSRMKTTPSKLYEAWSLAVASKQAGQGGVLNAGIPAPSTLTMPNVPTVEDMQQYGRTESVPLSKAVSFQSARNWDRFNANQGPGALVEGYGDKPLALRLETGEYVIYDGNHRTDLAIQNGETAMDMYVIDVKSYDPAHAGRKPVPGMSSDELLAALFEQQPGSATGNNGQFNPQDANILRQDAADLVVTHNLTADNLLHAVKMGGIAVPSLAVTKKDNPLTGFGEITLIGDKALADPKGYAGTKVFGADIYSPRYPSVTYEFTPNMKKRAEAQLKKGMEATDTRYIEWSEVEREGARELERNAAFLWTFLTDKGIAPAVKRTEVKPLPPALAGFAADTRLKYELLEDPAFVDAAWQAHLDMLTDAYKGDRAAAEAEVQTDRARAEERGRSQIVSSYADDLVRYQRDLRDNGKIDKNGTRYAMGEQVRTNDLTGELEAAAKKFIQDISPNERIFQGYTNSGNRKYVPHTLENVVKILKKELRGGENFNYGVGSLRAKFTPQFKSIDQIRKAKDRLVSKADFEKVKAEIDAQFWESAAAINGDLSSDTAIAIMEDAAKMGVQRAAKSYGYEVSDEAAVKVAEFLTRLRELPTEYFEAKILREVDLAEFSAAVVPEGVDPKVTEALQARGVTDIRTYKKGDEADRAAKINEFENLFFQNRQQGPRGTFNPQALLLTLNENADLSTFLHESGHFFLEVLAGLAADPNAPQEIKDDMAKVLKWFGVKDLETWNKMTLDQKRPYHEKWAESFEQYLFEGKAPTAELQPLFRRFRQFMTSVYKSLVIFMKGRNLEVNDEIRQVFDRMLATEDQIAAAEAANGMLPDFEATSEAIEKLQSRSLRDLAWTINARTRYIRELAKKANKLREGVEAEVREEVEARSDVRAKRALDELQRTRPEDRAALKAWKEQREAFKQSELERLTAELLAANPEATGLKKGQLLAANKRELANAAEASALKWEKDNPKPKLQVVDNDAAMLMIADANGFDSVDAMLRAIDLFGDVEAAVEGMTDQRMLERHGDLATPEAIEQAANEAVHNEARARALAAELKAQSEALNPRQDTGRTDKKGRPLTINALVEAAKQFAANVIDKATIRSLGSKASTHQAAEVRAHKRWLQATAQGDTAAAIQAKRDQLLNNSVAKAAMEARESAQKMLAYFKKFAKDSVRAKIDVDYLDQIDKFLERVDLRQISGTESQKRKKLAEWIASQEEMGLAVELPENLLEDVQLRPFLDMTMEEAQALYDTVRQIEHLGRLKNKLLTAKDQREFNLVKQEMVDSIIENSQGRAVDPRTPATWLGKKLQAIKNFGALHLKAATIARILDGGNDGGPVWEYLIRPANDAANKETTMRAEATKALTDILAPLLARKDITKAQFYAEVGRSLTREQLFAIALNAGNEGNLQRLLGGEGWSLTQVEQLLSNLTPDELKAVQKVWDYLETLRPEVGALERRMFGKEPNWVEPRPITITAADGTEVTLRGGYYPIVYDPVASAKAEQFADAEGAKRQLQNAYSAATVRKSFTKGRAEEVTGRPLLYSLSGVYRGVNDVIHYLSWQEWLVDANRLLRNKEIDGAIRNTYGPEFARQLKTWRDANAEGDSAMYNEADKWVGALRQSVSVAGLGFNVMSALIQPLGFTQSIARIGAQWVGKGLRQYIASPARATRDVQQKSEFMQNRARTRFRELNELRNRVEGETTAKRLMNDYAYWMMLQVQQAVDVPTWIGAYEKAIAAGNADDRAIELADQAVIDSQGGGQTKDLAAIERGSPAAKLFTVFYTFMNTTLQLQTTSAMTKSKARAAADFLLLVALPGVLTAALKNGLTPGDSGDDDKEWDELARGAIANVIANMMGLFVVGRELADLGKVFLTDGRPTEYAGPAGTRAIGDVYKAGEQISQGEFDDALRKSLVNLGGDLFGIPAAQINRSVTGAKALAEGKTQNPFALVLGFQEPR